MIPDSSKPSLVNRLTDPLVQLIFLYVDNPKELLRTCKKFHAISESDVVRTLWLIGRPELLADWTSKVVSTRPDSESTWAETLANGIEPSHIVSAPVHAFPGTLLTEEVCRLFVDAVESGAVTSVLGVPNTIALARSLWSNISSCAMATLASEIVSSCDITSAAAKKGPLREGEEVELYRLLDETSWREAVYLAIAVFEEDPALLQGLIVRPKLTGNLKVIASDALLLAARLNKVGAMKALVETIGFDIHEKSAELLKISAAMGNNNTLLYVVGQCGFSDRHDELMNTYRGLYILMQNSERGKLDAIEGVLEGWREDSKPPTSSNELTLFDQRWRAAAEMASENGQTDILVRLLSARTPTELEHSGTQLTTRMFALAICKGHNDTAEAILQQSLLEKSDNIPFTSRILAGLGSIPTDELGPKAYRYHLLKRYCIISNEDLAMQTGAVGAASTESIRQMVNVHRAKVINFLSTSTGYPLDLNSRFVVDAAWEAWNAQNIDAVKALKELGLQWNWMESAEQDSYTSYSVDPASQGQNRMHLPDSITMMLFSALGGMPGSIHQEGSSYPTTSNSPMGSSTPSMDRNFRKRSSLNSSDLGALIIAAETSKKDGMKKRWSVSDYKAASAEMSRDQSVVDLFVPRLMVNPEDKLWTAFLEGKLEKAQGSAEGEEKGILSWMEPMQASATSTMARSGGYAMSRTDSTEDTDNVTKAWKDTLGCKFDGTQEGLAMFLGLGGVIPESVAPPVKRTTSVTKTKAVQRILYDC
ncbi:hypothetical protein HDV05_003959 [Chytridiales sp. JEL 0842]|nr:hypothetical protein HDV05_003959 [Chytridiales sp. JEL 0842]